MTGNWFKSTMLTGLYGCGVDVGVVAVLVLQTEGEGARRDDVAYQFGSRRYDGGRGLGQLVVVVVVRYRSGSLGSNQLELGNVLPYAVECYQLIVLLQHDGEAPKSRPTTSAPIRQI